MKNKHTQTTEIMTNLNYDVYNCAYDMLKKGLSKWVTIRLIRFQFLEVAEADRIRAIEEAEREFNLV